MIAMLKSTTQFALIAMIAATPLCAQGGRGEATDKVTGSGQLPAGWMVRFDPVNPRFVKPGTPPPSLTDISFVTMGTGYHITSGPAAIYYNSKDMAKGVYGVSATFHQAKSMQHEAYGIFVGGMNLQDSTQNYLYLVIRPMDGSFAIEHRSSNAAPTKLVSMAPDAAVNKDSPTDGSATNTLLIHVAKDTVHFIVNGKLVKAMAKADLGGAMTDGQAGVRVNHNISVHVDGWSVK
jgi:hypothetical protein